MRASSCAPFTLPTWRVLQHDVLHGVLGHQPLRRPEHHGLVALHVNLGKEGATGAGAGAGAGLWVWAGAGARPQRMRLRFARAYARMGGAPQG